MKKSQKIVSWIIILIVIIIFAILFSKYNYNNFDKNIRNANITKFTRDSNVKYSKNASYKVENTDYNDAMFSQTIKVIPNTPYKVTCMVKTEGVENKSNTLSGGAHICLMETEERSNMIMGTNDWQELTFMFNSKNQTELQIGFRLGGYEDFSKGTAWFTDFKLEMGTTISNNNWKMACFIFPNIDVNLNINGNMENINLKMLDKDIRSIEANLARFKNSISSMSKEKIKIDYDIITINDSIKTLSYNEENGYYVSADDVYEYIDSYVQKNEYDHIFVAIRMTDKQKGSNTLISDWIGLGGIEYKNIGFSNIRMPDDENNLIYEYNYRINTFPEEVFLHEFLHTLERNSKNYGYQIPELHDYQKYGYVEDSLEGLAKWYEDYMNKEIEYNGTKIGLPAEIYSYKPVNESSFKYAISRNDLKEPSNIIEVINSIFSRIGKLFSYMKKS